MFSNIRPLTLAVPGRFNSPDTELKFSLLANSDSKALVVSDFSANSLYAISPLAKECDTVIFDCKGKHLPGDEIITTLIGLNRAGKNVVLVDPAEAFENRINNMRISSIISIRDDVKEALNEFCPEAQPDPSSRKKRNQLENDLTVSSALETSRFHNENLGAFQPLPEISAKGFALNNNTIVIGFSSEDGNLYEDSLFQNELRKTFTIIDAVRPSDLREVIVDLSGVNELRGSSASAVIDLSNYVQEQNEGEQPVKITLTGISKKIEQKLKILGLDRIFEVIPDRDDAFQRAQKRTSPH